MLRAGTIVAVESEGTIVDISGKLCKTQSVCLRQFASLISLPYLPLATPNLSLSRTARSNYTHSAMQWRGLNGSWGTPRTWHGATAADRPHGMGRLFWPAGGNVEYEEGVMAEGRMQGTWLQKWRNGRWVAFKFNDDVKVGGFEGAKVR